jgi:hypothetical protein
MHLSFVLLARPYDVVGEAIVDAHARVFTAAPRPLVSSSKDGIATLSFPDGLSTHVMMAPTPIPTGEAEDAAKYSLAAFSPKFGPLPPHTAHIIVTSSGAPEAAPVLDTLMRHTRIVAACGVAYQATAVYEGNARATHPLPFYVDVASSSDLPLMIWTGVSVAKEPNGRTSLLTLGMQNMLEVPDMLVSARPNGANEALLFALDMLAYVVRRGAPLPDGDTVGRSADEKIRVEYVPSPIDATRKVVRLDMT